MDLKEMENLFEFLLAAVESLAGEIKDIRTGTNINITIDTLRKIRNRFNNNRSRN